MKMLNHRRRRATVLVMVVSLLALLFVIVTGFINLARVERSNQTQVRSGDRTEQIVQNVSEQLTGLIAAQLRGEDGRVLGADKPERYSFEDIPGYRHSAWLASVEPVWNLAGNADAFRRFQDSVPVNSAWFDLNALAWPAVSQLSSADTTRPGFYSLASLIPESDEDPRSSQGYRWVTQTDFENYARRPMLDADGDGVPDSSFMAQALATELANSLAGSPVRISGSGLNINDIPDPESNDPVERQRVAIWRQFRENARYDAAVRVVSHGGMVTLDAPGIDTQLGTTPPVQRQFLIDLFDAVRHPDDFRFDEMASRYSGDGVEDLFADLSRSRSDVESALRRRGGMLPGPESEELVGATRYYARNVPPVLSWLQREPRSGQSEPLIGFPRTFLPPVDLVDPAAKVHTWERFNLADVRPGQSEREAYVATAALDPVAFNTGNGDTQRYARRPMLTAVNNSDDLARRQDSREPRRPLLSNNGIDMGTYQGELKFYLGDIASAFASVGQRQYAYDHYLGRVAVERLARLYFDMLESHASGSESDKWGNVFDTTDAAYTDEDGEVLSRRQQAFMLAVNTVAFAAPRDTGAATPGWIDTVSYADPTSQAEYIGYAPQPYFSEAIAYAQEDPADPNEEVGAVAIELFNPGDPLDADGNLSLDDDPFALNLCQFALAIGAANPNLDPEGANWNRLAGQAVCGQPAARLPGRSFQTFVLKEPGADPDNPGSNTHFDALSHLPPPADQPTIFTVADLPQGAMQLTLWRAGRYYRSDNGTQDTDFRWYCVDRFSIDVPDDAEEWIAKRRDLSGTREFGDGDANPDPGPLPKARWSVAVAYNDSATPSPPDVNDNDDDGDPDPIDADEITPPDEDQGSGSPDKQSLGVHTYLGAGNSVKQPKRFAPRVPLITMNAGPAGGGFLSSSMNNYPMFGDGNDLRPLSFPTPGFVLFVPRYASVHKVIAVMGDPIAQPMITANDWRTSSQTLEKERLLRYRNVDGSEIEKFIPADFGHMPIFTNKSDVNPDSYLGKVGQVPWGTLVFDYFTTVSPDRAGVDPLRIPGRINVNTAPWYLLSRTPVLGPASGDFDGDLIPDMPLPIGNRIASWPSPAFWSSKVGVLVGDAVDPDPLDGGTPRLRLNMVPNVNEIDSLTGAYPGAPYVEDASVGRYRLGAFLAQSAASYRDGIQSLPVEQTAGFAWTVFGDSHLRGGTGDAIARSGPPIQVVANQYRPALYGPARGANTTAGNGIIGPEDRPQQFGFVSVGELANVKGFDSSWFYEFPPFAGASSQTTTLGRNDFVKAVSLLALMDSQYLTTRSNTFTVYTAVMDRETPQASIRSQVTLDRSNLLPRLEYRTISANQGQRLHIPAVVNAAAGEVAPIRVTNDGGMPEVIAERQASYFNARFDD